MGVRLRSAACYCWPLLLVTCALSSPAFAQGTSPAFTEPNVIRSEGGVLKASLNLALAPNTVAGRVLETATYNASLPGPTLRVRAGDRMEIRLINNLTFPGGPLPPPQTVVDCGRRTPTETAGGHAAHSDPSMFLVTNIHTHGLQVSPQGNGDNPYISLQPGETCDYAIQLPGPLDPPDPYRPTQPAGLYWYHPHRHMTTSKQSWAGLAGAIIVEGDLDRIPDVAAARERLLVLQELWVDDKGHVPAGVVLPVAGSAGTQKVSGTEVPFTPNPARPTNIYYTVNGLYQPAIPIQPGETQRWRILNASPHRVYQLSLEAPSAAPPAQPEMYLIAQDGITLGEAVRVDQRRAPIVMAPGNRVEIIVRVARSGTYVLKAKAYDQGHPGGALPEVTLATVASGGPVITGRKIPGKLIPPADPSHDPIRVRPDPIVFLGQILTGPVRFFINGQLFDPNMTPITGVVGTTVEWTLVNQDVFRHPFHIHVNPFQVIEVDGVKIERPTWWDTFMLPPKRIVDGREVFGQIKIRMRFRSDVAGRTVFHCHFLPHEDNGMMSVFELVRMAN